MGGTILQGRGPTVFPTLPESDRAERCTEASDESEDAGHYGGGEVTHPRDVTGNNLPR